MEGRKKMGRQKIAMKKIENQADRLITFSKRRSGLCKKASELSTLCGTEIGMIFFSPAGKAYSYGHPSIESNANRFLKRNPKPNNNTHPLVEEQRCVNITDLNQEMDATNKHLEEEKYHHKMLKRLDEARGRQGKHLIDQALDELNGEELHAAIDYVVELYNKMCLQYKLDKEQTNTYYPWVGDNSVNRNGKATDFGGLHHRNGFY